MRTIALLLALLFALPLLAEKREVMIPMRDGVKLATNIETPDGEGPWPVILTRTPYGKDQRGANGNAPFVTSGYVQIVQDCRGKFKSGGKYRAFEDDRLDGFDTIEWIAKQPWSNKKIGMVGASATGITAYLAAMSGTPYLKAAYVSVAHGSGQRYSTAPGGVFLKNMSEEWLKRQGAEMNNVMRPVIRHYDDDARANDIRTYLPNINVPFYNVGGWYDIFLQGDIDGFVELQAKGGAGARGNQKLVMGAFGHGALSGDLKYPATAGRMGGDDTIRWFDYWLKGVDNGIMKDPPVKYFVMGDTMTAGAPGNEWRTAASWPPAATPTSYYFQEDGKLSNAAPNGTAKKSYIFDPKNPVPSAGGGNLMMERGPMDQRPVSNRSDVLKFETAVLDRPIEIAGAVNAELFVSTDAEDTDFHVKLIDVYPNGYEALVLDQAYRMRYFMGLDRPSLIEKNKVYKLNVALWSTALVVNKGHKIAVHVQSSNNPRFDVHTNTWDPIKGYDQAVKATNTVHMSAKSASRIVLPVTKVYGADANGGAQ